MLMRLLGEVHLLPSILKGVIMEAEYERILAQLREGAPVYIPKTSNHSLRATRTEE
jgi:hypothetical protein